MNDQPSEVRNGNPHGGVPSGEITLPPYYRPTPDLASNLYHPGQEERNPDEMRNASIGSTPTPVTRAEAGSFFFYFGFGCIRNTSRRHAAAGGCPHWADETPDERRRR